MRYLLLLMVAFLWGSLASELEPAKFSTSIVKPWGYQDAELAGQGLLPSFTRALANEAGVEYRNTMRPYPRVIKEIEAGSADFAVMFASPHSEKIAVDLGLVVTVKIVAVAKAGEAPIQHVSQLAGKRVGVIRGSAYGPDIDDNPLLERISFINTEQGIQMLLLGRIDAMIAVNYSINYALQELDIAPTQITSIYHLATRNIHLYWSRSSSQIEQANRLQLALARLREDGVLDKIFALDGTLANHY
ncbi:substrate-binding periplasmic protein [Agarivorans aestuarii]|uniref:substrate-binding periplasmic protein n=1 Tax=Agarivorans aestuarii TaxID=1563703 RepID=UPI001C7F63CB|nr:transporter substrate-binding domain-containing protein [Agarivorans aestuarii]